MFDNYYKARKYALNHSAFTRSNEIIEHALKVRGKWNMNSYSLSQEAILARKKSYAPYSNFLVGAALLTKKGNLYHGCNIENAGYTPTVCAERTAFFKAVSEGEKDFLAIAVAGWLKDSTDENQAFPCGVCRQVMREFCDPGTFKIIVVKGEAGGYTEHTLEELLPYGFGPENLRISP